MDTTKDPLYYKGYLAGYRDGIRDAANGVNAAVIGADIVNLPLHMTGLSTRAQNCLLRVGCTHILDVAAVSEDTIATMRNLGAKTAAEIAHWLDDHGLCYSAWCLYL